MYNKKVVSIVVIIFILMGLFNGVFADSAVKSYTNKQYGIKFSIDDTWKQVDKSYLNENAKALVFYGNYDKSNISLYVNEDFAEVEFELAVEVLASELKKTSDFTSIKKSYSKGTDKSLTTAIITFDYTTQSLSAKGYMYLFKYNDLMYSILFMALPWKYEEDVQVMLDLIDSIKLSSVTNPGSNGETTPEPFPLTTPKPTVKPTPSPKASTGYGVNNPAPLKAAQTTKCSYILKDGTYYKADLSIAVTELKTGKDALAFAKACKLDTSVLDSDMTIVAAKMTYSYSNINTNDKSGGYAAIWFDPLIRIYSGEHSIVGGRTDNFNGGLRKVLNSEKITKGSKKTYSGWVIYTVAKDEKDSRVGFCGDHSPGKGINDSDYIWFKLTK